MASHEDEDAMWDPCPRKLLELVESEVLPIVVKVQEGVYGKSEGSTFSNGDLIKIDSYITIDKVRARAVGGSGEGQGLGETFTVPLDYHGKVALLEDAPVVKLVNDLKQHVTKRVMVLQDATFYHQGNEKRLNKGDVIKILEFKGRVMYCTRGQEALQVPTTVNGQFQVLSASTQTEYSVRDLVTSFSLPQVVHFIPAQQQVVSETIVAGVSNVQVFCGDAVLESLVRERVAVGHFKGSGEDSSRFARRSVIILPLTDPMVAELEVLCHHYSDDSDYQFFQMTHFSQSSGELVLDPNALYMDFSRPGVRFIEYKDFGNEEKPPPRPPRRNAPPKGPPEGGRESPDYLEPVDYGAGSRPPVREQPPSRPAKRFTPSDPRPRSLPHHGTEYGGSTFTLAELGTPDPPKQTGQAKKGIKKILKKFFHSRSPSTSSTQEVPTSPTSPTSPSSPDQPPGSEDSDENNDYTEIEDTNPSGPKPQAVVRPTTRGNKPSTTDTPTVHGLTADDKRVTRKHENDALKMNWPPPIGVPLGVEVKEKNFQEMGVADVIRVLEGCSMSGLAEVARENKLDGEFLSTMPRAQFFQPPFNMEEFGVLRFERIKSGWRPKK